MPQTATIQIPKETITQITNADAPVVTFQNTGGGNLLVKATVNSTPPTDMSGALVYWPNQGEKKVALADLFLGLTSPVRLWGYSDTSTSVFISHA